MNIPSMPWYKPINNRLKGVEWLVNALLITIAILCVVAVLRADRIQKTAFMVYLLSP